jgi:AcrR family transcriptional regulator
MAMTTIKNIKDVPLKQRKQARTRLALLDAATELLQTKPLSSITVEEICQEVEVSRGTFFRYFPRKVDLLFYHLRLWNIEAAWYANKVAKGASGLVVIEALFDWAAQFVIDHPHLFSEIIALRAFEPLEFVKHIQSNASIVSYPERLLRFPDMEGIDSIPDGTFHRIFQANLEDAIANKQLPENTNIQDAVLSLASMFYGVPLMIADRSMDTDLASAYKKQLHILWAGLRSVEWESKPSKKKNIIDLFAQKTPPPGNF